MSEINIGRDSKFIKVLAAQAKNERVDGAQIDEAAQIVNELVTDLNPENRHKIAQTIAYTVDELQQHDIDFLNAVADIKNVNYGDKAVFNVKTGGVKAYIQAKGSTTARSYISDKQFTVDTVEISARPAIHIGDVRRGKVNMADMIREANREMTQKKLIRISNVLHDGINDFSSPFYATGTGVVKATIDAQIAYFRRLGGVNIIGDPAAVGQLIPLTGMAMNSGTSTDAFTKYSDKLIDEANDNGFVGRYNGCSVIQMANGYLDGTTTPVMATNWLYFVPAGMTGDTRNLKVVNEGSVSAVEAQDINDMTFEVRLDQWLTQKLSHLLQ